MKILYAALRHDPKNPDLASGVDYNFYNCFLSAGFKVKIVGPFTDPPLLIERLIKKIYVKFTGKRYLKWDLSLILKASYAVNQAEKIYKPDVIFTIFPATIFQYKGRTPIVFRTDTTFQGWQEGGANFGRLPLRILTMIEHSAVKKSSCIITFSDWCKNELIKRHRICKDKIYVLPMPSALPSYCVPKKIDLSLKKLQLPLKLLLVGRDYKRKGVDIAININKELNKIGIASELTVCGLSEREIPKQKISNVKFVGPYRKSKPEELKEYIALYQSAHFLLHPARFEPAGIAPAEAAAFGVPTITNNVGGLATSVKDGVSGIVLPKFSPPDSYIKVILSFLRNQEAYYKLCETTRRN